MGLALIQSSDDTLYQRLINWGRWRWRHWMAGRPDSSCANPMYEMAPPGDAEGYADEGETGSAVVVALRPLPPKPEPPEIDEEDAENLEGWIKQLPQGHRATLGRRFVTWDYTLAPGQARAAMRALYGLMDSNYEAVREMERRLRQA